jgi:hypothetical protein
MPVVLNVVEIARTPLREQSAKLLWIVNGHRNLRFAFQSIKANLIFDGSRDSRTYLMLKVRNGFLLIPENRADDGARTHEWWNHKPHSFATIPKIPQKSYTVFTIFLSIANDLPFILCGKSAICFLLFTFLRPF